MSVSAAKSKDKSRHKPSQREVDDAIAALIASTKRKARKLNPLEVVEKIEVARDGLGSLPKVAQTIGLSYEMLRQIFSVRECAEEVKKLVRRGKLSGYDVLHRLSKLKPMDQIAVAKCVVEGEVDSDDVRAIVSFQRNFPKEEIERTIRRIRSSKNIRRFIVYFEPPEGKGRGKMLYERCARLLGKENIVSIEATDNVGRLVLTPEGKKRLQEAAKRGGVTKRTLVQNVVTEREA